MPEGVFQMNNQLQAFQFESRSVRTLSIKNEPWFVGKDIATVLGYERPDNAIRNHVDDDDKLMHQISASGQNRNMVIINESGMYSLTLSSKLSQAKRFKKWVTSEVLPSIRKHGMYAADELLNDPDLAIKAFTALKEERARNAALSAQITQDKPYADFGKAISTTTKGMYIGAYAKLLANAGVDTGEKRLFAWMRKDGYLCSSPDKWNQPKQQYLEQGLFQTKACKVMTDHGSITKTTTLITGKGQKYFTEKLKEALA